ncbi:MAG: glycosyltransferase [Bacteroidales bacterium]|nr:glycosyltransferase [Bacteroidales bacterium]
MKAPKISVVTVSYNTVHVIARTLESVLSQTYGNTEYIVIDGASTDGAAELIRSYADRIDHFVSEPDKGLYDAMNKGIRAASGDFVLFLNADDVFADYDVLGDVAEFIGLHPEADVIYGNSVQVFEYGSYQVRPGQAYLNHKMCISHQATFVRTELLRSHPFDTRFRYAADFEQLSHFYLSGAKFVHFDRDIAHVEMRGGTTFDHQIESANELYDIIASRGVDIEKERRSQLRRKRLVRFFKRYTPKFISYPLLRFLAERHKAL